MGSVTSRNEGTHPRRAQYSTRGLPTRVGLKKNTDRCPGRSVPSRRPVSGCFFPTGGHVSPAVAHRSQVWKLPGSVEPLAAAGLVLTQVGYNCGMRPALQPGDAVVVLGDGLVGHWSAQTLQHRGARVL